jgi:UDP-glucose 4-epimerase
VKLDGRRILITGAAGFIGSHLSDRLAGRAELLLVDDFSIGARENLMQVEGRDGVRIVEADVSDREHMRELLRDVEVVFHLAISCLRTSLHQPWLSHDTNAGGTLAVCLAAREHEVQRVLYVSSSEVYGSAERAPMDESHPCNPTTVYGASKLAGELYALACFRTWGLPVSVVRPFNTYGPREPWRGSRAEVIPRFILQLEAGRSPVVYGDGRQTRDFTYVSDTVDGLVAASECDELVGGVVNVARGSEVSIGEIAERLSALTGRSGLTARYDAQRPGDVARHYADVSRARHLFGYAPRVSLEQGLERTLAWFREHAISSRPEAVQAGDPNW